MSLDKQQRRSNCGKDNIEKKEKKLVYRIGEQKTKGQKKSHETDHTVARSFNLTSVLLTYLESAWCIFNNRSLISALIRSFSMLLDKI